jgi:hypothetical protein
MIPRTRRPAAKPLGRRTFVLPVLVGVVAIIGAALWFVARDESNDDPVSDGADPGVAHVHGLGINPADGALIVATHYGSFRIPAGSEEAVRLGGSFQDTMGFTVAGPDHFLGSGHPDVQGIRSGQPTRLGLIESTDGGLTWTGLSLGGEVDFHGLAVAHDRVYGWDSGTGRFMVSDNRVDWDTRSTVDLYAFAVDVDHPDHVIGAGADGLLDSTDGGRTWRNIGGPQLAALSWEAAAGLWGVDPGGAVWHRDGGEWQRVGALPGEPQAILATADALYAAAHDDDGVTGIYRSTDDGRTWDLRYRDRQG